MPSMPSLLPLLINSAIEISSLVFTLPRCSYCCRLKISTNKMLDEMRERNVSPSYSVAVFAVNSNECIEYGCSEISRKHT